MLESFAAKLPSREYAGIAFRKAVQLKLVFNSRLTPNLRFQIKTKWVDLLSSKYGVG